MLLFTISKTFHTQRTEFMSYQEKQNLVNIFSGLLITTIYGFIIYQRHQNGLIDLTQDYQTWGKVFLIFMGVSIAARILIYIIFHIFNAIATREETIPVEDERLQLIKLKATRNSYHAFSITFLVAFILLTFGMPIYGVLIAFVAGGLFAEIIDNLSQIYYHRKGI